MSDLSPETHAAAESQLIAQLRAGDRAAFERLVRTHGPRMLAVARRLLGNDADAADALQDAFLSAHRSIGRFEGQSQLGTWLHRITVNAALMKLRGRRREAEASIDGLLPKFLDDGHHAAPAGPWRESGADAGQRAETRSLVRRAIDSLPESYRTILMLRDIEELDTAEAAKILGIEPGAVKVRLHRARQALRALLDPHFRADAI